MLLNILFLEHYVFMARYFPPFGYFPNPGNAAIFHCPVHRPKILAINSCSCCSNCCRWAKISSLLRGATYL